MTEIIDGYYKESMTENEVLKDLQNYQGILKAKTRINASANPEIALDAITEAIEVIQQYRAIGTVEECKQRKEYFDIINEVLKDYSDIGTIEECRVAVERMNPKKYARKGGNYDCPVCGYFIFTSTGIKNKYCSNCGQAIDWSE